MKTILISILAVFTLGVSSANACTVSPVDEIVQTNDLAEQALNHLNISIAAMDSITVSNYHGEYIWTPMCPEGLTSGADFEITFSLGGGINGLPTSCIASLKVDKTLLYENGQPEYEIKEILRTTCLAGRQ